MADWYARTQGELGPWWANFFLRRPEFEAKYPILATMKNELDAIAAWVAYWTAARHVFDELGKQQSGYFNTIAGNDTSADPPSDVVWTMPPGKPPQVPPGIEKIIREVRREVVGYANYAKADGEAMGLEATAIQPVSPSQVTPTLKATVAATGYMAAFVISGREKADSWELWILNRGESVWIKVGTYTGKSVDVTLTPTTPGDPYMFQARAQGRRDDANYGNPSPAITLTLVP